MKKAGLVGVTLVFLGLVAFVILINARLTSSQNPPKVETLASLDIDLSVSALDWTATLIASYPGELTVQTIGMNGQPQWGFIENPSVPIPGRDFQPENAWKFDTGDGYVLVIAGYSPSHDDQGIIFIDINRQTGVITRSINVPDARGSVRIVNTVGTRLELETKDNKTLYFDLPGLRFVDSLDEVVPTVSIWGSESLLVLTETTMPASP